MCFFMCLLFIFSCSIWGCGVVIPLLLHSCIIRTCKSEIIFIDDQVQPLTSCRRFELMHTVNCHVHFPLQILMSAWIRITVSTGHVWTNRGATFASVPLTMNWILQAQAVLVSEIQTVTFYKMQDSRHDTVPHVILCPHHGDLLSFYSQHFVMQPTLPRW